MALDDQYEIEEFVDTKMEDASDERQEQPGNRGYHGNPLCWTM